MNINNFVKKTDFAEKGELDKTLLLGFYYHTFESKDEFSIAEVCQKLGSLGFSQPNKSRLDKNVSTSKKFVKGKSKSFHKLHYNSIKQLEKKYAFLAVESEEIITSNDVLPESLYKGTRGFIEKLALQINASYENNIPDGCAVLMRRLLEVLLVLGYQHVGRESDIKDSNGDLKNLSSIINFTVSNKVFSLSKDSYTCIDTFRKLGNFSAHRIQYNCKKSEIEKVKMEFRVLIEELFYKSGIKK